jgi:integrase
MTDKNRRLLQQFDNPDNVIALITLPQQLLAEAKRHSNPKRSDALLVMTAVAIEILVMVPIRMANLIALNLDRHLLHSGGPKRPIHLFISGSEVKNGFDIQAELPAPTSMLLDVYLAAFRSLLLDQPSPWLFPGINGNHRCHFGLADLIQRTIDRKTGLRVHPHLFRHIAAKIHLTAFPGDYGTVRLIEGHKSVETTARHYAGTETGAAYKRYDSAVLRLREQHFMPSQNLPRRSAGKAR